jgi:hypothetical protein
LATPNSLLLVATSSFQRTGTVLYSFVHKRAKIVGHRWGSPCNTYRPKHLLTGGVVKVGKMSEQDKDVVKTLIDAFITKGKLKQLVL